MSVQNQSAASVKVLACGKSGTGKSTLLEKLIKREKCDRLFIYCHKDGDMSRRFKVRPCRDHTSFSEALAGRAPIVIYEPSREHVGKPDEGFEYFCKMLWGIGRMIKGKKGIVADELQSLVDERSKPDELVNMLEMCRTYEMLWFFGATASNGIHNRVRGQITEVFAFHQDESCGTDWLEKGLGMERKNLSSLKYGQWIYKNTITGKIASGGKPFIPKGAERDLKGL